MILWVCSLGWDRVFCLVGWLMVSHEAAICWHLVARLEARWSKMASFLCQVVVPQISLFLSLSFSLSLSLAFHLVLSSAKPFYKVVSGQQHWTMEVTKALRPHVAKAQESQKVTLFTLDWLKQYNTRLDSRRGENNTALVGKSGRVKLQRDVLIDTEKLLWTSLQTNHSMHMKSLRIVLTFILVGNE